MAFDPTVFAGGGGGSFDPDAAVNITFADGQTTISAALANGGNGHDLLLKATSADSGGGGTLRLQYGDGAGDDSGSITLQDGTGSGFAVIYSVGFSGSTNDFLFGSFGGNNVRVGSIGADLKLIAGGDIHIGATGFGQLLLTYAPITFQMGMASPHIFGPLDDTLVIQAADEQSLTLRAGASGGVTITCGGSLGGDSDTANMFFEVPEPSGTDRNAGAFKFNIHSGTGVGTDGYFQVLGDSGAQLCRIDIDGTITVAGSVYAPSGSSSAPGYAFTGDTDTGMFQDGGNTLGLTIGSKYKIQVYGDRIALASELGFCDTDDLDTAGAVDAGVAREGPAVVRVTAGSDGSASEGIGALVAALYVEANTADSGTPNELEPRESSKLLTNEGAGSENYELLPDAAPGLRARFYVQDAVGMRITAKSGDTIRVDAGVSDPAGFVRCATVGARLELVAVNATEWVAWVEAGGTWTVDA